MSSKIYGSVKINSFENLTCMLHRRITEILEFNQMYISFLQSIIDDSSQDGTSYF